MPKKHLLTAIYILIVIGSIAPSRLFAQREVLNADSVVTKATGIISTFADSVAATSIASIHLNALPKNIISKVSNAEQLAKKLLKPGKLLSFFPKTASYTSVNAPFNYAMQIKAMADLSINGMQSDLYIARNNFDLRNAVNDLSFHINPEKQYKALSKKIVAEYSTVLNRVLETEIKNLKGLQQSIQTQMNAAIDSIVHYSRLAGGNISGIALQEINYNAIIGSDSTGNALLRLQQLEKEYAGIAAGNGKNEVEAISRLAKNLSRLAGVHEKMKLDSLVSKYEELASLEKGKMVSSPGKLKKFIKQNQLKAFKMNPLMWFKNVGLGNFFSPGSAAQAPGSFNIANVFGGTKLNLNNKLNLSIFLGKNVTEAFDRLWHPNGLELYRDQVRRNTSILRDINAEVSLEKLQALGGINLTYGQNTTQPNAMNSFFGLGRKFQRFSISRTLQFGNHQLMVDLSTHYTSYTQTSERAKVHPEMAFKTSASAINLNYNGMFRKAEMEISGGLQSTLGNKPVTSTGYYERPSLQTELSIKKFFYKRRVALTANFNSGMYDYGVGNKTQYTAAFIGARFTIDRKNILDVQIRNNNNRSKYDVHSVSNNTFDIDIAHNTQYKKNGLKYSFFSKAGIGKVDNNNIVYGNYFKGMVVEVDNNVTVSFPNNISIHNNLVLSLNSFSNRLYLNGNRLTVSPGISFSKKKFSYAMALVFENVDGFYIQGGIKNSLAIAAISRYNISINASLDSRYSFSETAKIFPSRFNHWGNIGLSYSFK